MATATTAWATVTSIVLRPAAPNPPILGHEYILEPNDDIDIDTSEWWKSRLLGDCSVKGVVVGNGKDLETFSQIPGQYSYILTNTYLSPGAGEPAPPKTTKQRTITIAKADNFADIYGVGVPVTNPGSIVVKLQIYSGDKPCGPYMTGLLQQKLTDIVVNGERLDDKDWAPTAGGETLNLIDGEIHDEVASMADAGDFDALPMGTVFYSATQAFRILYTTPCTTTPPDNSSPPIEMPLGSWTISKKKVSATQWQYE